MVHQQLTVNHQAQCALEPDVDNVGQCGPLAIAPLKMLATAATYWSGVPGGVFTPSIAAGTSWGLVFSHALAWTDQVGGDEETQ